MKITAQNHRDLVHLLNEIKAAGMTVRAHMTLDHSLSMDPDSMEILREGRIVEVSEDYFTVRNDYGSGVSWSARLPIEAVDQLDIL